MNPYDDYLYIYEPPDEDPEPDTPEWRKRLQRVGMALIAIFLAVVLLASMVLPAWDTVPILLGYWNPDYRVRLTDITGGVCNEPGLFNTQMVRSTNTLCVCGVVQAQDGTADFHLTIRETTTQGNILKAPVFDTPSGAFCETLLFDEPLRSGDYQVRVTPRLSNQFITGVTFFVHPSDVRESVQ